MSVTDWKFAGTAENYNNGNVTNWVNVDYAKADDTSYTTQTTTKSGSNKALRLTNYGFSSSDVPDGATINGFEVEINRKAQYINAISDVQLYLLYNGSTVGSNMASANWYPYDIAAATYGGSSNMWGTTLSQSNILDNTFGIHLLINVPESDTITYVDYIKIRVYYTAGGTGGIRNPFNKPFYGPLGGPF